MENIYSTDWDLSQEQPGYVWDRIRLGHRIGARMLGASVYLIKPGQRSFPYHFHHGNEEMLIVLEGAVTVRTPNGEQVTERGDAMGFLTGPDGAHQLINHTDEDARVLMMSTMVSPEIVQYPDSGKVGVFAEHAPGDSSSGIRVILDGGAAVDYFDAE